MMISDEWLRQPWRWSLWLRSQWVRQQVRSAAFWDNVEGIVELITPMMQLLRRLDRGGGVMSRLWSWSERVIQRVAQAPTRRTSRAELDALVRGLQARRRHMLEPAHYMAHLLNPRHRSIAYFEGAWRTDQERELAEEADIYLRQQAGLDRQLYQDLRTALREFHSREGDCAYGSRSGDRDAESCRGEKETSTVAQWWVQWGDGVPLLQSIAVRLMHTWTCASPAERNWVVHERVQVKRRNKLGLTKLTRLVEISTNLRLLGCHTRGVGYVLPWEDEDVITQEERPEARDSGVRHADKVSDEQLDRQTPVPAGETPISQVVRGLDIDVGVSSNLLMEAAQGMDGTPSRPVRSTRDAVRFPSMQEMDVETDVDRRDREERQRTLALAQSCPVIQDIRASLDAARDLETEVTRVAETDLRETCGTRERTHGVEEVQEGEDPRPAQGDGRVCRPGLDPIRGEDNDVEGGGDGAVGGGDAPHGGSDAVGQHDACEEDRQTISGGYQEDAGGVSASAAKMRRYAVEGTGKQPADSEVATLRGALVEGICVLPLGGTMSAAVLECNGREDPLAANRWGRMEDSSRRALGEPPPYASCSPFVPSSMTGVTPPLGILWSRWRASGPHARQIRGHGIVGVVDQRVIHPDQGHDSWRVEV
ncbi:hypothetical protein CBR_g54176 [Chara braunii]|uniref:HAT C-terminal dimerisation domain-containing protein n=1 Tax=Chara braunii TaxID=69332 RepID=A0A388K751_CHABU|nr:hypothetical protein CBR_g54176 [Chara braunii]|eukprot:GBG65885.1 hypothetical protein CBR_g54176 [Chara braunii]